MAQQTAVDWFSEKVFDLFNEFQRGHISIVDFRLKMITIEEQAKSMEKEQIAKAWDAGWYYGYFSLGIREIEFNNGEEYYDINYNETYNK